MRIFFILEKLGGRGGVEAVVRRIVNALVSLHHEVIVFLPEPSDDPSWEKDLPQVIYYNKNTVTKYSNGIQFITDRIIGLGKQFSLLENPDLVIATHVPHTVLYARINLGKGSSTPLVSWLHSPPEIFINREFINYADLHWSVSKGVTEKIEKIVDNPHRIVWIGNPIELDVKGIQPSPTHSFVYIGRLENREKRLDILFHSLATLFFEWKLQIFGIGSDELMLKELADHLGILDKITFMGWDANPWDKISEVTALLLSSDYESFSMVIGEALSRGVPVLSTDCDGPKDLIIDQFNGWLTPKGNVEKYAQKLKYIASLDQEQLNEISYNARNSVKKYSTNDVLIRMKHSLKDFIAEERWNL